jgi:hypothetical protein
LAGLKGKQTGRHTYEQMDGKTDRQTVTLDGRQAGRKEDVKTYGYTNGQTDGWIDEQTDG